MIQSIINPRRAAMGLAAAACLCVFIPGMAAAQNGRAPARDPAHQFQKRVWSYQELKRMNIVMQQRDYSCGAAALATVIKYYWGDPATEEQFLNILADMLTPEEGRDRVENGLTLTDLRRAAVKAGYLSTIGKLSFDKLTESKVPLIVGITVEGHDHFVVYRGTDWEWVYLADPIRGNIRVPVPEFNRQWQKNAVLVVAKPNAEPKEWSRLSVRPGEIFRGETNWQVVRTFPSKVASPPRMHPQR
jgi:predicted double-glycine peptidase